ncbi:MAG: NAD(P)/FAD-dependent oxidoreductase [Ktedonobacteraceae bacterium]|nr:NAD(P)/FAD-dependent oxidoreductase [Ktedonobacteraceae bacterium]
MSNNSFSSTSEIGNTTEDHLVEKNTQISLPSIVIIGAGFGGLQAARALGNAPVKVTVIDRTNHHLFQPLLYQVATAALSPADISAPVRHVLRNQKNTNVILAEVAGIDVANKHVLMHDKSLSYDYLIIATGARENYFGHDEWRSLAPGLKSIEDATTIRRKVLLSFELAEQESDPERVKELLTFIVVGAGATGVELAGAIAEISHKALAADFRHIDPKQARILLIEAGPRILPAFPEALSRKAHRELVKMGVEVQVGLAVSNIDTSGVTAAGEHIGSQTVIWTAGVQASQAGQWLGNETDRAGRVKVSEYLTIPDHPEVFVIGDTALNMQDGRPLPGVAPVAMQQGRYTAATIKQRITGKPVLPFRYHDKGSMATVGRSFAIVKLGPLQISGFPAWVTWMAVHIMYLIGFQNRLLVMMQWAWAFLTFQRRARLITHMNLFMLPVELHSKPELKDDAPPTAVDEAGDALQAQSL